MMTLQKMQAKLDYVERCCTKLKDLEEDLHNRIRLAERRLMALEKANDAYADQWRRTR